MYEKTLQEIVDLCDILNGLVVSFTGYGDYDEIRIMCLTDTDNDIYYANYVCHNIQGGFVHGGEIGSTSGYDITDVFGEVVRRAFNFDDISDVWETVFEVNAMKDLQNPSTAELIYGSEAWNAYDRGYEVR